MSWFFHNVYQDDESQWADAMGDWLFAMEYPHGVPCKIWTTTHGDIEVSKMSSQYIKNCMNLVGEDDPWYEYFEAELDSRAEAAMKENQSVLKEMYSRM